MTGYVDLGELGVADRWWDIAVGGWSVGWNFGRSWSPCSTRATASPPTLSASASSGLLYDLVS